MRLISYFLICCVGKDGEGKTAEDLAEAVKENEIVEFLRSCAKGTIPAKAPAAKVNNFFYS